MKSINYSDILDKFPDYDMICKRFIELFRNETDRKLVSEILINGEVDSYKVNSELSNRALVIKDEVSRRLSIAEILFFNHELFDYMLHNRINVFQGTLASALPSILEHGIMSHQSLVDNGIKVTSGEGALKNSILNEAYPGRSDSYNNFVSLTDDFAVAKNYSLYSQISDEPKIIICLSEDSLKQRINLDTTIVPSYMAEIGFFGVISPEEIKCIITSPESVEYVKLLVNNKVPVFSYGSDMTFKLNSDCSNIGFYGPTKFEYHDDLFELYKDKYTSELSSKSTQLGSTRNNW